MNLYSADYKLADVINKNYSLLPVINRLGIKLGVGDKTIKEICREQVVNQEFFLDIINIFHNENYFPKKQLLDYPINLVTNYLSKTHQYYIEFILADIERNLKILADQDRNEHSHIVMLQTFYVKFKDSFIQHTRHEEQMIFPYACMLDDISNSKIEKLPDQYIGIEGFDFDHEHSLIDEKMSDLKNIIIKYLPPFYNPIIMNALLHTLFLFEKDLKNHAQIEDKILIPKINYLKQQVTRKNE